jgi:hypothetical protein
MSIAQCGHFLAAISSGQERDKRWGSRRERSGRCQRLNEPDLMRPAAMASDLREAGRLCGRRAILVDETTKHVVTPDRKGRDRDGSRASGDLEIDGPVRPLPVVVADVLTEDALELAMAEDEHLIEALGAYRSYPALRGRVGSRCPDRRLITRM